MSAKDLDAAGIGDPGLRASYERCRRLHAAHGRTYYLATLLLPPGKRPYVNALYGFARHVDDIVDDLSPELSPAERAARLRAATATVLADLAEGSSRDPIGRALVHTTRVWGIPHEHFEAFLDSMAMDLTVTSYARYADLERYMYGSAAVIGLQMTPILEPLHEEAPARACALGVAFQLSNFLRDVGEDLQRGRVYLPSDELAAFGVSRADLDDGAEHGTITAGFRALMRHQIHRARQIYAYAEPGIGMLHPTSQDCIRTAFRLYGGILDEIERADYRVLDRRVGVPLAQRLRVALPAAVRARRQRRRAFGPTPYPAGRRPAGQAPVWPSDPREEAVPPPSRI